MKRLWRRVRAELLAALFWLGGRLPLGWALRVGDRLGGLAFLLLRGERARGLEHLAIAFPELPPAARRSLLARSFRSLGRSALELTQVPKLDLAAYVDYPEAQAAELRAALAGGRGGILALGHLGNWELVGPRLVAAGFAGVAIGRESGDRALAAKISALRRRWKVPVVARGASARPLLSALRGGKLVAVLIDQDTRTESLFVPFFGRLASTPAVAEALLRLRPSCCVFASLHRKPGGAAGHVLTTELIDLNAPQLTARLTARIEAEIRRHPEEWVWMHRRWRRRPSDPAAGPASKS